MASRFEEESVRAAATYAARCLGYQAIRDLQMEVVLPFVMGKDVFGILPTGYGKSLCYGCLPMLFDQLHNAGQQKAIVIVATPLTAIMEDQVSSWSLRGLSVASINSNSTSAVKAGVIRAEYSLVFFTPELLLESKWREILRSTEYTRRVKAFVVDEAHTVKKWGETFREALLRIGEIRSLLPKGVNIMALTATATRSLRKKVGEILGMHEPRVVAVSPSKPNIVYRVTSPCTSLNSTFMLLAHRLKELGVLFPRTIIYCRRIEECANLYEFFKTALGNNFLIPPDAPDQSQFRCTDMYTAITDTEVKSQIISSFSEAASPLRVVCATSAFGMGVDCPDVREVIHFGVPNDSETYIQETGRAGHDKKLSIAILVPTKSGNSHAEKSKENSTICRRDHLFSDTDMYVHEQDLSGCAWTYV